VVPSSLLGLVLFVIMLAPGLAYVLRHEQSVPAPDHSPFRESLRVIFVSVACFAVTLLLFAGLRWLLPDRTPDVRGLIRDPDGFVREHHVHLAWWAFALVAFATLLGATAADPRVVTIRRQVREAKVVGWLLGGQPSIRNTSAWRYVLTDRRLEEEAKLARAKVKPTNAKLRVFAGAQMADGSYIQGYVVSYDSQAPRDDQRELTLADAKILPVKGQLRPIGSALTVLSAGQIVRLDVTYVLQPFQDPPTEPDHIEF